jgi:hypothetical protein
MLTFVITSCCCSLQSSSLVNLCNALSISSTDGSINATAFWNHAQKNHQLLLNFWDIIETMLPYLRLYSSKQEGAKSGKL